ncbi:unnamed protein product [Fusarium graminearum]|uniref:Uncharacterized protein n=1 Tax=Gibberella zeae TaxID=5518 RepID=A0A4V6JA90_GIBZA|nr:unnamed protein product [Fusarium graminearum]CAG1972518.1 unnamed protein product [Fusarium graminearum]CAG1984784.1 unnamed protein product [Fusarium graminearum]CAG2012815.1 unnamed protein product [Fusarium graminearum]VTO94096.1 unnamed protein product [Fusarium graminearum]
MSHDGFCDSMQAGHAVLSGCFASAASLSGLVTEQQGNGSIFMTIPRNIVISIYIGCKNKWAALKTWTCCQVDEKWIRGKKF